MVEEKQKPPQHGEPPGIHEKVPVRDIPADIVKSDHPFAFEVRKVFHGNTKFGQFIQPLAKQLAALPEEEQTESLETFELIHGFLKDKKFPDMEFT